MFRDRIEAGEMLAEKLARYRQVPGVVLAVPRGGVPVAYMVAKKLGFPIDLILTKKIGHPNNKEYAIGAANLTDHFVAGHEEVSQEYIERELLRIRQNLKDMYRRYMGGAPPLNLEGKTIIVVDDGIATGNTILGTVNLLRKSKPARIIVAAPVASDSAVEKLGREVDEVVVVLVPDYFTGVGAFYEDFRQVEDEEVMYYLDKMKELRKTG